MARIARIETRDRQLLHCTTDSVPKIYFDLILEVAAGFLLWLFAAASPASEKLAKEIAEAASAALCSGAAAKVKASEIEINAFAIGFVSAAGTARRNVVAVKAVLVVHLAFFGVGEDVVGFLQLLEFFFGGFVAGIQVGMIFAGELAESRANVFRGGFFRDP